MKIPLTFTDITAASIASTQGSNTDSWKFAFYGESEKLGSVQCGTIYDNANSFNHISSVDPGSSLRVNIKQGSEAITITGDYRIEITYDTIVIELHFPELKGESQLDLYYDKQGVPYYDASLTEPAVEVIDIEENLSIDDDAADETVLIVEENLLLSDEDESYGYVEEEESFVIEDVPTKYSHFEVIDDMKLEDVFESGLSLEVSESLLLEDVSEVGLPLEVSDELTIEESIEQGGFLEMVEDMTIEDIITRFGFWSRYTAASLDWNRRNL